MSTLNSSDNEIVRLTQPASPVSPASDDSQSEQSTQQFPWNVLQTIAGLCAAKEVWQEMLGDYFEPFQAAFLETHSAPLNFPADLNGLKLNSEKLGRALCRAFELQRKACELPIPHTWQIGAWSADAVPVILTIQSDADAFRHAISELSLRLQTPFILLSPTKTHLNAAAQQLLVLARAGFFSLESTVMVTERATIHALRSPGELFSKFTPQPQQFDEDSARRAFALVEQLDSRGKPPSALTVFRLYCVQEMSIPQIARKCRCSVGTVGNRLAHIRRKTGVAPQALRRISIHMSHLEEEFADSRVAHIPRQSLMQDDGG
jgi:hypothetical protein